MKIVRTILLILDFCLQVVIQWAKEGGVLLIGYELYRQLSLQKARKRRVERKRKLNPDDDIDDEKNKHLLEGKDEENLSSKKYSYTGNIV